MGAQCGLCMASLCRAQDVFGCLGGFDLLRGGRAHVEVYGLASSGATARKRCNTYVPVHHEEKKKEIGFVFGRQYAPTP